MLNFWETFTEPFFVLAPMEDVTDTVFRELILSISDPDVLKVVYTEFTSTDGLMHENGRDVVAKRLVVNESERTLLHKKGIKLVAQIWGNNPETFYEATKHITENYDFDGIDINMGCPVKNVVKSNTCSALIKFPDLAKEIILATKSATHLPVSVKTRTGFTEHITEEWTEQVLTAEPHAFILHGRTRKMMSDYPADWTEIAKAVQVNKKMKSVPFIGNGDVASYQDGIEKHKSSGVNGLMVGTGVFKNPWIFNKTPMNSTTEDKLSLMRKHIELYETTWGTAKNVNILKKYFKIYVNDFQGASQLRAELMEAKSYTEFYNTIDSFQKKSLKYTI